MLNSQADPDLGGLELPALMAPNHGSHGHEEDRRQVGGKSLLPSY